MFLKRIEMQGFKSFADHIEINFEHNITGVVGPNGCGKSNITDAIKWVLGEQSAKSLRGSSMSDVIFNGSENRRRVNLAWVTLVFDNTQRFLNYDQDEVEVTRRLHRETGEGEYFINKQPVRLRDVQDLTLDSGLGRDSLSIISQGTISNFADAKPIERRALFEEQAGVAKYRKRKQEALGKLARTQENIERMLDIVEELERQVKPLKTQAKKAKIYEEKRQRLQEIEVSVLVNEIKHNLQEKETLDQALLDLEIQMTSANANLHQNDLESNQIREQIEHVDRLIHQDQEELMEMLNKISHLEAQKVELDQKSKYAIEVGDILSKQKELTNLYRQAKEEYDDRRQRLNDSKANLDLLNQTALNLSREIVSKNQEQQQKKATLYQLQSRRQNQQQLLDRPFVANLGISTILDNRRTLVGVHDVVSKILAAEDGYELAISSSLGGVQNYIVVDNQQVGKEAINFLKRNASGRATFIPLDTLKIYRLQQNILTVAQQHPGFLGTADQFVQCDPIYDDLALNLLGQTLVCENIDDAHQLAKLLHQQARIVTLEGDLFHRGGNMTGGKTKENTSLLNAKKEVAKLTQEIETIELEIKIIEKEGQKRLQEKALNDQEILQLRLAVAQLEPIVDVKHSKMDKLQTELELLDPQFDREGLEQSDYSQSIVRDLNNSYAQKDNLVNRLAINRENRTLQVNQQQRIHQQMTQLRQAISKLKEEKHQIEIDKTKREGRIEGALNRLSSEYQMTYEFAQEKAIDDLASDASYEVVSLRQEIAKLGAINMDAPAQYEEVNQRYEFLQTQLEDLSVSRQKLLEFIDEMDDIMTVQFKDMFDRINKEFDGVFKELFNGGTGRLVLEDPEDILNTGIDIDVQPPGKSVQNIRLFSGGEKSLIAISVLFSMMKARKMPLAIFDEVEAALDQANVERFAKYLSNFSDETQFIVVTHRPGTMAQADVLYGVTMAQKGVSSLLKVKLSQAIGYSDEKGA